MLLYFVIRCVCSRGKGEDGKWMSNGVEGGNDMGANEKVVMVMN